MFQIGNERVALVTDTSCDLSDEQLSQYDIRTVALRVATSQGEFRDRLEITQEQLYDLLQREVPKTSLPLPEDVSNLYRTLHDEGATSILHLSISGSLSGTFNMVSLLAEDFEDMKIHVFDSKTLSCGLGLLVLEAAESLQNGMSVEDTIALLEKRREHQLGAFVIRTLEFLRKGGRIGRVRLAAANQAGYLCERRRRLQHAVQGTRLLQRDDGDGGRDHPPLSGSQGASGGGAWCGV